jgi:hypothetical protein
MSMRINCGSMNESGRRLGKCIVLYVEFVDGDHHCKVQLAFRYFFLRELS